MGLWGPCAGRLAETSSMARWREATRKPITALKAIRMEEASVIMTGLELERVLHGLAILEHQERGEARTLRSVSDYSMPNVSDKVLRIILSYTDYVNRTVWKKN